MGGEYSVLTRRFIFVGFVIYCSVIFATSRQLLSQNWVLGVLWQLLFAVTEWMTVSGGFRLHRAAVRIPTSTGLSFERCFVAVYLF